jgi:hypothetical protein
MACKGSGVKSPQLHSHEPAGHSFASRSATHPQASTQLHVREISPSPASTPAFIGRWWRRRGRAGAGCGWLAVQRWLGWPVPRIRWCHGRPPGGLHGRHEHASGGRGSGPAVLEGSALLSHGKGHRLLRDPWRPSSTGNDTTATEGPASRRSRSAAALSPGQSNGVMPISHSRSSGA